MKRSALCLTILLSVVFLSTVLIPFAWAPPQEKPEKLSITGVKWSSGTFYVGLNAQFGVAQAGDNAGFLIVTTLDITTVDGLHIVTLSDKRGVVRLVTMTEPAPGEPVPIEGPKIDWKPEKPYGTVFVNVTVELKTSGGSTIGTPTTGVWKAEI
jgi:hypothetical protein